MELIQSIIRIAVFLILAQTIVHLSPRESYEKYIKLLVRLMLIASLLTPLTSMLTGEPARQVTRRILEESRAYEQSIHQSSLWNDWDSHLKGMNQEVNH
ncbi:MAG: stage III sporulation protein AF [Acetatifactor sp.]